MQWYYSKDTTQMGPVSFEELRAKLGAGEVCGTDRVWRDGMKDWLPVSLVDELKDVSQAGPVQMPSGGADPYAPPVPTSGVMGAYGTGVPTSGLAIASLVCGIVGLMTCFFVPGIPAVICGHMALNRMADPSVRLGGRGMAIAGLVTGYLSLLVLAGFVVVILIAAITG